MKSVIYTETAALEEVKEGIDFCRMYTILPCEHFKDKVELSDKTILD